MGKKVEQVIINTDGVVVVSVINGVTKITQLELEPEGNKAQDLLQKYNLSGITNYPFDMKIVRALAENDENDGQLREYLEVCRKAHNTKGKIDFPDSIPDIFYDLKQLKASTIEPAKQLELYKDAKQSMATFKGAKGKVQFSMGVLDRAYYSIQEFLQSRNHKYPQALNAGISDSIRNFREELRNSEYTEKTNEVSKEYALQMANGEPMKNTDDRGRDS